MAEEIRGIGSMEAHARLLLHSYWRLTGKALLDLPAGADAAEAIDGAERIILSHDAERDPVLNYGNLSAMRLWEMDWDTFTRTPSRLTAEPMEREERASFLARVAEQGYVDDYTGIRISSTGKRFYIVNATVWNLLDEEGAYRGQAAAFAHYRPIEDEEGGGAG